MITHASRPRVIYIVAMEKIINCGVEHAHRQISVNCRVKRKIRQRIMKKQHRSVFHSMRVRRSWNATWYFQSRQPPWAYSCLQVPTAKFRNRLGGFWKCQKSNKNKKNEEVWHSKRQKGAKGSHKGVKGCQKEAKDEEHHQKSYLGAFEVFFLFSFF